MEDDEIGAALGKINVYSTSVGKHVGMTPFGVPKRR